MKARALKKPKQTAHPGFDGAVLIDATVKMTAARNEVRIIRCRPGTFEWRYGRKTADATLYHAGVKFADLWERAGTASASSPDMGSASGGQWKGIPDSRVVAMSEIDAARKDIGKWGTARLVDYCVMGSPSSEIGAKYGMDERAIAFVLFEDLQAAARHFTSKA